MILVIFVRLVSSLITIFFLTRTSSSTFSVVSSLAKLVIAFILTTLVITSFATRKRFFLLVAKRCSVIGGSVRVKG